MPHATPSIFEAYVYDKQRVEQELEQGSDQEHLLRLLLIATQPGALLECEDTFVVGVLAAWDVAYRETTSGAWIHLVASVQAINFKESDAPEDFVDVAVPPLWRPSVALAPTGTHFDCLPQQYVPLASYVGGKYRFHSLPVRRNSRVYGLCVNARLAADCLRTCVGFEIPDLVSRQATVRTEDEKAALAGPASANELLYFGFATRATLANEGGMIKSLVCVDPMNATQEHYATRAKLLAAAAAPEFDASKTRSFEIPGCVDKFGYRYVTPSGGSRTAALAYLRPPMEGVPLPARADPAFKVLVSTARTLPPSQERTRGWMGLLSEWDGAVAFTFVNYHDLNVRQTHLAILANPGLSLEQMRVSGRLNAFPPLLWPEVPQARGKVVGHVPAAAMAHAQTSAGKIINPDEMDRNAVYMHDHDARRKKVRVRVSSYLEPRRDAAALCYMEWGVNSDKMARFKSVSAVTMPPILTDRRQPVLSQVIVQSALHTKCEEGTSCSVAELRYHKDGLFTSLDINVHAQMSPEFMPIEKQSLANSLLSQPKIAPTDYAVVYELPKNAREGGFLAVFGQICKAVFSAPFDHMVCKPCLFQILARKLSKKAVAQLWKDMADELAPQPSNASLANRVADAHRLLGTLKGGRVLMNLRDFLKRPSCQILNAIPAANTNPASFDHSLLHVQMNLLSAVWYAYGAKSHPLFNYASLTDTKSTPPVFLANMLPWFVDPDTVARVSDTSLSVTARTAYKLRWVTITQGAADEVFELITAGVLQPIPRTLFWGTADGAYRRLRWLDEPTDQMHAFPFLCLDMVAPNRARRAKVELEEPFFARMQITFEKPDAVIQFVQRCAPAARQEAVPGQPVSAPPPAREAIHPANWRPQSEPAAAVPPASPGFDSLPFGARG